MAEIAIQQGIIVTTQDVDLEPVDMDPLAELPRPIQVVSTESFRQNLRKKLVLQ